MPSPVDEGHLIGVQGVVDEFESDEAEDRGQAVVQVDEAVQQAVDEEVELAQPEQREGIGREDEVGLSGQRVIIVRPAWRWTSFPPTKPSVMGIMRETRVTNPEGV